MGSEVRQRPYLFCVFSLRIELVFARILPMFDELREAIATTEVPVHADAIVELRRLRDALDARLAEAEATYSRSGGYEADGFGSMAAFLRQRARAATGEARREAKRADRIAAWPEVLDAWRSGVVTGTQVELMAGEIPDRHVERFAVTAAQTCSIVAPLSPLDTRKALERWVDCADALAEREAAEEGIQAIATAPEREVWLSRTSGGVGVLKGELDTDSAAITEHALRLAQRPDIEGERRSPAQRRADALVTIAQHYVDTHTAVTSNRRQERLTVSCDIVPLYGSALRGAGVRTAADLQEFLAARPHLGPLERGLFLDAFDGTGDVARTLDGNPIGDGLLSCISEGGVLARLLTVGSRIIDHGRGLRAHTAGQWRALAARDGGCRYPGCDDPVDGTHAHHVERWETGGGTDVEHGVLLSPHCHTVVHQPGWSERLEPDGTYTVITPRGEELTSRPPGAGPPGGLPIHSTAEKPRPLPFDPGLTREPSPDPHERLARPVDGPPPCRRSGTHPRPGRRGHVDLLHGGWVVSLS
jgi:hypothetical protein